MGSVEPVVLVMCPPWGLDAPPLSIAYLKAYLERSGRTVYAMDFNIEIFDRMDSQLQLYWSGIYLDLWTPKFFEMIGEPLTREMQWVVDRIMARAPRVVGFTVNQSNLNFSFEIAKRLRARDPRLVIVFGGPGVYWVDRSRNVPIGLLNTEGELAVPMDIVDIFVHGEGEEVMEACLKKIEEGGDLCQVNAITARQNGGYRTTGPHRPNLNVDVFPFPVFDWVHFDKYKDTMAGDEAHSGCWLPKTPPGYIVPILLSRGCTNNCKFCNDFIMQGKYRFRSAKNVFEEMRQRVEDEGFKRLYFCDLLVNGNLDQLRELSQLLIESGLPEKRGLVWTGQALARGDMDRSLIDLMARSGCRGLAYGVESLSEKVLLAMRKGITVSDIESVLRNCAEAGMENFINLIVGHPDEGEAEFEETLENLKRFSKYIKAISSCTMMTMTYGSPHWMSAWNGKPFTGGPEWHRRWVLEADPDNVFEVRSRRLRRLEKVASELGLATLTAQHYEDAFAEAKGQLAERASVS